MSELKERRKEDEGRKLKEGRRRKEDAERKMEEGRWRKGMKGSM
jgi:hypothetical protein